MSQNKLIPKWLDCGFNSVFRNKTERQEVLLVFARYACLFTAGFSALGLLKPHKPSLNWLGTDTSVSPCIHTSAQETTHTAWILVFSADIVDDVCPLVCFPDLMGKNEQSASSWKDRFEFVIFNNIYGNKIPLVTTHIALEFKWYLTLAFLVSLLFQVVVHFSPFLSHINWIYNVFLLSDWVSLICFQVV